jgi:hypothetical protein
MTRAGPGLRTDPYYLNHNEEGRIIMPEIEQVRGRHRWDPLVDAEQPLMRRHEPPVASGGDVDESDNTAPPWLTEGSSAKERQ